MGLGLSIVTSLILTIIVALIIYQFFVHNLREKKVGGAIVTLSFSIFVQTFVGIIWEYHFIIFPYLVPGFTSILGVRVVNQRFLLIIGTLVLLVLFGLFFNRTRLGKSLNAIAQNIDLARLVGINIQNTFLVSMGISAFLAGFAAVLYGSISPVVGAGELYLILAIIPGLVLGGLGSLKGAIVGSFVIAFIREIVEYTIGSGFAMEFVPFALMSIVIIIKPSGLFGKEISKMKTE